MMMPIGRPVPIARRPLAELREPSMPMLTTGIYVAAEAGRRAIATSAAAPAGRAGDGPRALVARFSPAERQRLLLERGIGPATVSRLERAGFNSIAALRQAGAHRVVDVIVEAVEVPGWKNRLRALDRVIHETEA
jgi:hypothetical protein